ncbi:nuclear transport factor 2 family protein [Streptomyces sp. NEAU-YJ-81]|uniref:nuclear transport factor 2 family protein n=1 Tax=Streptomyces sp. NEAU-YJ-81 TaxID=2820288 RepID=UPI001ABC4BEB|nr:nuclear transport factor 2 family protein [Streptomyces sp. NEAU-YJ-81]MBO3681796.1 nuclear transport factor 2 family protein [Streptomyces sp. NEAU-YJ-81]
MSKAHVEYMYKHLAEGNFGVVFEKLSPHAPWIEAENVPYSPGAPLKGREAIQKTVFDSHERDFAEFHINVSRIVDGGDTVLVQGRYVGVTKAGAKLDAIFAHVWDFDGDTIVRFQQYSDTWQWRRVLGLG